MTPWFRRRNRDGELTEEIRTHLEMAVRDRVDRGEPRAEAEAAARRELGNVLTIAEVTRGLGLDVDRAAGAGPALRGAAAPPQSGVHLRRAERVGDLRVEHGVVHGDAGVQVRQGPRDRRGDALAAAVIGLGAVALAAS